MYPPLPPLPIAGMGPLPPGIITIPPLGMGMKFGGMAGAPGMYAAAGMARAVVGPGPAFAAAVREPVSAQTSDGRGVERSSCAYAWQYEHGITAAPADLNRH